MLLPCLIKISYNRELKRRSWLRRTSTGSGSFFIHEQYRGAPPPPHSPGNNVINDTAYCAVAMTQKPSPPTSPTVIGPSTDNQKNTSGFKPPLACIEIAWVAQKVEGEGEGEKHPLPFSPFPYPLPLSTPATQASIEMNSIFYDLLKLKRACKFKTYINQHRYVACFEIFFFGPV